MSNFDQRWRQLVALSRQAEPPADPLPPRRRWPLPRPLPRVAHGERRGRWLAGTLAAVAWVVALWLTPLLAGSPQLLPATPLAMTRYLPPLPHPPSPGSLLDGAYRSLTTPTTTLQDPHL
jgi:hypothetical protein